MVWSLLILVWLVTRGWPLFLLSIRWLFPPQWGFLAASPTCAKLWFSRFGTPVFPVTPQASLGSLPQFFRLSLYPQGSVDGTGRSVPTVGHWISLTNIFFTESATSIFSDQPSSSILDWVGSATFGAVSQAVSDPSLVDNVEEGWMPPTPRCRVILTLEYVETRGPPPPPAPYT